MAATRAASVKTAKLYDLNNEWNLIQYNQIVSSRLVSRVNQFYSASQKMMAMPPGASSGKRSPLWWSQNGGAGCYRLGHHDEAPPQRLRASVSSSPWRSSVSLWRGIRGWFRPPICRPGPPFCPVVLCRPPPPL